jgi:rRNA biogenesis protein RRP5
MPNYKSPMVDISSVEISNIVDAVVTEIHKENAWLTLQPTKVRALISLKNMANHRSTTLPQLRASLKEGDKLEGLIVVSRNPEKGIVIVAHRPTTQLSLPAKGTLSMSTVTIGQVVGGRVTRHTRNGAFVKLTTRIGGILHPTDVSDNYETGTPFPAIDTILKAVVIGIDVDKQQLALSTRHSRMYPDKDKPVADRDITSVSDLQAGDTVRGFIKHIAEHGLFVTLAQDLDARVQIKELFDEVGD